MPLILLPPSEGKASGGSGPAWTEGSMSVDLDARRLRVMTALRVAMRSNAATRSRLLGVKGAALAAATAADRSVLTGPTMPAIERYTGVLYGALDTPTLGPSARRRLERDVLIVSGLWGLVGPGDPIPDYKLKMGTTLPRLGKLSTWWRDGIDAAIGVRLAAGRGREPIWNLLPNEHDAAWTARTDRPVISVRFLEPDRRGELVAVAHWNKLLKGALVRFLVEHPGAGVDELAAFDHPAGYTLAPELTAVEGDRIRLSMVAAT